MPPVVVAMVPTAVLAMLEKAPNLAVTVAVMTSSELTSVTNTSPRLVATPAPEVNTLG